MADALNLNSLQEPLDLPFPATTKQGSGDVKGIHTEVMTVKFSDRILITISQKGRLGHWVRIPIQKPVLALTTSASCSACKQESWHRRPSYNPQF
ncbi:uncharacterized protein BJX67DRAFT_159295 [Aspergillus lucknowensis]|uniref:Uncharacterized protein n=1 Tax=Aspergillus lucknowensis TaxID=176173 RepID=A0ABR4M413_9EURO